jgi:hypothetical protein
MKTMKTRYVIILYIIISKFTQVYKTDALLKFGTVPIKMKENLCSLFFPQVFFYQRIGKKNTDLTNLLKFPNKQALTKQKFNTADIMSSLDLTVDPNNYRPH